MKKRIYYAHCIAIYNTPQEGRDVATLESLGFAVANPNCPACDAGYKANGMSFFEEFADICDAIAFRANPDGSIPAGVAKEISWFVAWSKPVIELPSGGSRRVLTVEQTREYLHEVGQR